MPTNVRLKLDCIPRVLAFCRRHPECSAAALQALARLEAMFELTRSLLATKLRVHGELPLAIAARDRMAAPLAEQLTQVVQLARAAALHEGDGVLVASLAGVGKITPELPLDRAEAVLEIALRHRTLLDRYGMPEGMLDRLGETVARYAAQVARRIEASATIAEANDRLEITATEAHRVIKHLDALYRIRFSDDPVRWAEWRSARRVPWDKPKLTEPEDGRRV